MHSRSKLGKLWKRVADGVVQDVPPNLHECETCRDLECTQERWESCQNRLDTEAALLATPSSDEPADASGAATREAARQEAHDCREGEGGITEEPGASQAPPPSGGCPK